VLQDDIVVFGWIAASSLIPFEHVLTGSMGGVGAIGIPNKKPRTDTRLVRCAEEVPLVVDQAGTQRLVGAIASDTVIEILPGEGDLVEVDLDKDTNVRLDNGARWFVPAPAVAACPEKR
jgi:hypothetical protein